MAMVVNETKLNAAMTATADAIREKLGSEEQIPFDYNGGTGFADAVEAIPQGGGGIDPYDKLVQYLNRSIKVLASKENIPNFNNKTIGTPDSSTFIGNCQYISLPNATYWVGSYYIVGLGAFLGASKRYFVCIGCKTLAYEGVFAGSYIDTLVLSKRDSITVLSNDFGRISRLPSHIYVPSEFASEYKIATNWVNHADTIYGYDEAPAYNASATYGISDVCQYNGKFYAYRTEDLESSSGNAPSGTTADNNYWEYIAEVEV